MKKRNFKCSSVSILQPQEANHVADRCKYKRSGCLFAARRKPVYFASKDAQKSYVATEIELLGSGMGNGENPPLFICQPFHLTN